MWKQKLMSRKFWMAVAGAVLIIANEGFDLGIPEDAYWEIVALAAAYVFGEALVDAARVKEAGDGGRGSGVGGRGSGVGSQ